MTIQEYIDNSGYPQRIKDAFRERGLKSFIDVWMHKCNLISRGFIFVLEEYMMELNLRSIIEDVVKNCDVTENDKEYLNTADKKFKENTIELKKCIDDDTTIEKHEDNWFYFRIPTYMIKDWGVTENDIET